MRKFFSMIAAVLFAGSMMASVVTLDPATQTNVDGGSTGVPVELTIEGVTIAYTGGVNATNSPADFRVFGGQTLTLSAAENISKVVIAGKANKAGWAPTVSAGTITTGASYADITTKATLEDPLFVVENINAQSITITCNKQLRAYLILVTLGEGGESGEGGEGGESGEGGEGGETVEPTEIPTYDVAAAIAVNPKANDSLYVRGVVKQIQIKGKNFAKYGSATFVVADATGAQGSFEFFNCFSLNADTFRTSTPAYDATSTTIMNPTSVADANGNEVKVGDTIVALGAYNLYNNRHQLNQGCYVTEIHACAVAPEPIIVPLDTLSCAEAKAAAAAGQTDSVYVLGYVTEIAFAWKNGSMSFWMADAADGGKVFEAYKCAIEDEEDAVRVGDYVLAKGKLAKFNNTSELAQGCTVEILERGEGGEGGEYSYEYEPTEVTEISFAAESMKIEDYTADYGVVYIELVDADDNWIGLEYISSSYDAETGLAAGVYPINATEEEGTFFASPGGDDDYDYGCYVGMWVDDEYYNPYYLVSGTVTIGEDGSILVSATSYNGSTVSAVYTPTVDPEEAIDNTNAEVKAVKSLRHGRLEIERNGNRYNAQGIRF